LAGTLKVSGRVKFLGWLNTPDARKLYRSSTCAVVTGQIEPYGYTAIDPLALGTSVIVSSFTGLSDYLLDTSNVFSNVETLVEKISAKISMKPSSLVAERKAAMHHVANAFSIKAVVETFEGIMRDVRQ
jgi:glycosyltransferase involved in cell wall biosynthesis